MKHPWFAAILLLPVVVGCSPVAAPAPVAAPPPASPDLVVLLVPGLAADLGGTPGAEAALLNAFGPPTVRFSAAYSQSPAPFVSLGSLLTGMYASALPMCGLYDDGMHPVDTTDRAWCATIPQNRHTLPDVLGIYGYRTALFTSGLHGAEVYTPQFQTHVELNGLWPHRETPWTDLSSTFDDWWNAGDAPHFAVLALPELMPTCRPELLAATGLQAGAMPVPGSPSNGGAAMAAESGKVGAQVAAILKALPSSRPRWVVLSSTNAVSMTASTGLAGGNVVPSLSNNFLLERTVHVPLAIYGPTPVTETRQVDQVVELTDLFPTLAKLAGALPPAGLPGEDLLAITTPDPNAWAYAEFGEFLALRQGPLMLSFRSYQHHPTAMDPQLTQALLAARDVQHSFRLHDVTTDPWQATDLSAAQSARFEELRKLLITIRTGVAAPPDGSLDPRKLWDLRMSPSQGYW